MQRKLQPAHTSISLGFEVYTTTLVSKGSIPQDLQPTGGPSKQLVARHEKIDDDTIWHNHEQQQKRPILVLSQCIRNKKEFILIIKVHHTVSPRLSG